MEKLPCHKPDYSATGESRLDNKIWMQQLIMAKPQNLTQSLIMSVNYRLQQAHVHVLFEEKLCGHREMPSGQSDSSTVAPDGPTHEKIVAPCSTLRQCSIVASVLWLFITHDYQLVFTQHPRQYQPGYPAARASPHSPSRTRQRAWALKGKPRSIWIH